MPQAAYLSDDDAERVSRSSNLGNALLQLQGYDVDTAEREGYIDVVRMAPLEPVDGRNLM